LTAHDAFAFAIVFVAAKSLHLLTAPPQPRPPLPHTSTVRDIDMTSKYVRTKSASTDATQSTDDDPPLNPPPTPSFLRIPRIPSKVQVVIRKPSTGVGSNDPALVKLSPATPVHHTEHLERIGTDGYTPLINAIWAEELSANAPVTDPGPAVTLLTLFQVFKSMAGQTLVSMEEEVVQALGGGNLAHEYHHSRSWR